MERPSTDLLRRLAQQREIAFRPGRLPTSRWMRASDGVKLHYLDWPGGPSTLVLLHGGALSAHTFDLLALALDRDARCIAVDLRGHGRSGWLETYSVERWASDILDLLDHLGEGEVNLAGMSLGGCIAGHAATALGAQLASLTFIDVGPRVNFASTSRMRAFIGAVRPVRQVDDLVRDALAISPRTDPDLMLYRYQALLKSGPGGFVWKADRRRPTDFPHILDKLAHLDAIAPLIACPVLVVKGERSKVMTQREAKRFAGLFPQGRCVVIPGAGHNVQEDQPVALAAALRTTISHASARRGAGR
ncbi:MAG TPA: alpha/beta hydrolase [Phenylobacterium sp.]|nr:alpha/beta hydrolase [Phenylobacterium sp.]